MPRGATQAARAGEQERPAPARSRARPATAAPARTSRPARAPARRPTARRAPSAKARPARARAGAASVTAAGVVRLRAVAPSPAGVLDRLLRGRAWVACIGALLAGIVFLNVALLEVNGGIATVSERATALKRENAELQLRVAQLASSERIQAAAAERGYALPEPAGITYLEAKPGSDGRRAARALERRGEVAQVAPPLPASGQPATPTDAPTPTPPVAGALAAPASEG